MPVFVVCPSGHRLKVPRKHAGVRIICPVCEQSFVVPPVPEAEKKTPPPNSQSMPAAPPLPSPALPKSIAEIRKPARRAGENPDRVPLHPDRSEPSVSPHSTSPVDASADDASADDASADDTARPMDAVSSTHRSVASDAASNSGDEEPRAVSPVRKPSANPERSAQGRPPTLDQGTIPMDVAGENPAADAASHPTVSAEYDDGKNAVLDFDAEANLEIASASADPKIDDEFDSQSIRIANPESQSNEGSYGHPEFAIRALDEPTTNAVGVHSDLEFAKTQAWTAWWLGAGALIVAVVCAVPALLELLASQRGFTGPADSWTYYVLLGALIQSAVAMYALNLPDWTTTWIACLTTVGLATLYAMGLALTTFASQEHALVQQLGLLDESYRGKAQPWCFLATCLSLMLAYGYGRFSVRWLQVEKQLLSSRNAA